MGLVLATALASCTAAGTAPVRRTPARLVASATQFRPDEGTRNLHAGITNLGPGAVTVTAARVEWPGFTWPRVRVAPEPVPAGQTAAFLVRYGAARCETEPGAPYLVAVVDGRTRRLPLKIDLPGLLERLRAHACAQQRLSHAAGVRLRWARTTVAGRSGEYLPGALVLRRRAGTTAPVVVVGLSGSVLFDLLPARRGALPARLAPADDRLRLPVRVEPAGRCDGHARGQSQQTFLFSAYTRLDGAPAVRTTFLLDRQVQQRLQGLLDRACGRVGPAA